MATEDRTSFGATLKHHRSRARLSQEELAERAGISVRAISNLERGLNRLPRNSTIRMLATALELSDEARLSFEALAHGDEHPCGENRAGVHNLPLQLTPFIGRDREVELVRQRLGLPEVRLLTLRGSGGVGKTRLALRVAEDLVPAFSDGVYFVGLASVAEAGLVGPAIASAMGVREVAGQSLIQRLEEHLRTKHILLVLDNFEHVVLAGNLVAHLLATCARLKVLITSRVVVRISAEHDYVVPPLAMPDVWHSHTVEQMQQFEAVQLFVSRTQAVNPEFTITTRNASVIAEICQKLDGLPLAIELAAARSRLLSPQGLLSRLDNRLALLTGGAIDVPSRQQALRVALDWSYNLLEEPARWLLRQMSVFPGGCTLETIEVVCGCRDGEDILETVSALLDSSLLQQQELLAGDRRFHMLETIREYALARLAESGEERDARMRQAQHYLELVESARSELDGPQERGWLEVLETEHDNLRSVLDWTFGNAGDAAPGLQIVVSLWAFWEARGYLSEGRRWLQRALRVIEESHAPARSNDPRWWAEALRGAGVLAQRQGDYQSARNSLDQSLERYRQLDDARGVAMTLNELGRITQDQGNYAAAQELHEQSLALYRQVKDRQGIADALYSLGLVASWLADYDRARQFMNESLAIRRELGSTRGIAAILQRISQVMRNQGDLTAARVAAEESLALQREIGDRWGVAYSLNALGNVARDQGDYAAAATLIEECLHLQQQLGDRQGTAYSVHQLGIIARASGDLANAQAFAEESLSTFRDLGHKRGIAYALAALGATMREQKDTAEAHALLTESLRLQSELGDKRGIANAVEEIAALAITREEPGLALRLLAAIAIFREEIGDVTAPAVRHRFDLKLAAARTMLTAEQPAVLWEEGQAMSLEQAAASAQEWAPPP